MTTEERESKSADWRRDNLGKNSNLFHTINMELVGNDMPEVGTKEFNDMCFNFFGGNPSKQKPPIS
jgi:hypothetical protein